MMADLVKDERNDETDLTGRFCTELARPSGLS